MYIKFKNLTDEELANQFIDARAYTDEKSKQSARELQKEIVDRFVNRYATYGDSEEVNDD